MRISQFKCDYGIGQEILYYDFDPGFFALGDEIDSKTETKEKPTNENKTEADVV